MGKFIITEEEKNHIKGLYEQSSGSVSSGWKEINFPNQTSGTTSGTTGAHSEFKQIDIKEDSEGTLSSGLQFTDSVGMELKKKQFKINSGYNVATLKHPKTGKIYTVTPSTKYANTKYKGLKITYVDKGVNKSYEGPHDACDVVIDRILDYKSLEGGYNHK